MARPNFSFPGGYRIIYLIDGLCLCGDCAPSEADVLGTEGIHWEGPSLYCEDCGRELPSEYGDPNEPEQDEDESDESEGGEA